ncbi:hypothetical protein, partial [Escherichia coli]|uniref:hypothetical protein n=1 Tax=Escherichia coli TaxID=562 RepID=UPI00397E4D51
MKTIIEYFIIFLLMVVSVNCHSTEYKLFSSKSVRWNRILIQTESYSGSFGQAVLGSIRATNSDGIGQLVVNQCYGNQNVPMKNWYGNEAHVQGKWQGSIYCDIDVGIPKGSNDSDDNYVAYIDSRFTDGVWKPVKIHNGGGCL